MMNKSTKKYFLISIAIAFGFWAFFAFIMGFVNAQNQMNWCQYKNGMTYITSSSQEPTGKRWSPNPLTIGFTGECINPGDKGL